MVQAQANSAKIGEFSYLDGGASMGEMRVFMWVVISVLFLSGCGSTPPMVGYEPNAPLSDISHYRFLSREKLRVFNPLGNDLTNNRIELAVEKTFASRNINYSSEAQKADIVVSYFVLGSDKQYLIDYNRGVKPCASCPLTAVSKRAVVKYERGTVIVDFLDPKSLHSVWRGALEKMLKPDQTPSERNENIKQSIRHILAEFPPSS